VRGSKGKTNRRFDSSNDDPGRRRDVDARDARDAMSRGAVTRVVVAVLVLASIADARVDGWMDREMKMKTTTKTVSSATIGAGGLAASASDAESCRRATWRVDAVEACGIVATRAETRCEFAVRATTCRLRRAGGRARVEACVGLGLDDDLDDGDGERGGASCERCALRAFAHARDAAARWNPNARTSSRFVAPRWRRRA